MPDKSINPVTCDGGERSVLDRPHICGRFVNFQSIYCNGGPLLPYMVGGILLFPNVTHMLRVLTSHPLMLRSPPPHGGSGCPYILMASAQGVLLFWGLRLRVSLYVGGSGLGCPYIFGAPAQGVLIFWRLRLRVSLSFCGSGLRGVVV